MEEDKEFFILILGVLAAIILVISWWFTTGGIATAAVQISGGAPGEAHDGDGEQAGTDEGDTAADGDEAADGQAATDGADHGAGDDPAADDADTDDGAPDDDQDEADEAADAVEDASDGVGDVPVAATVFDAIAARDDLSVVRDLLRDTGLDRVLAGDGPFTVFAPSNDAINQAASSDTTVAVLEADRENVLTYHVVPGTYTLDDLTEITRGGRTAELMTVQGEFISLTLESGSLMINGSVAVDTDSVNTGNGIVHMLDNVLVPPVAALNALVGLDPILFATGSADIEPESFATLDRFIDVLQSGEVDVTIEGHTDSSGDPISNQNLSQSRARSVLNYLVANGVDESRLSAVGFGPDRPVADNQTEEGRALNRRIEFSLG